MRTTTAAAGQRGQGTVEYVGVVVVVALLLVAATALLARRVDLGTGDPGQVVVVAPVPDLPLTHLLGPRGSGRAPSVARRAIRLVRRVALTSVRGQAALVAGFTSALARDLDRLATDPIGTVRAVGQGGQAVLQAAGDPVATARNRARLLRRYLLGLRRLGFDEGYVTLMGDVGRLAEQLVVARGRRWVARRAAERARLPRANRDGGDTDK